MANGTNGRVYGGDPNLVHIPDGERTAVGRHIADHVAMDMRLLAAYNGDGQADNKPLCPGCYMVAIFNASVFLAKDSGQSIKELGRTMAAAYWELVECDEDDPACIESITVKLDAGDYP